MQNNAGFFCFPFGKKVNIGTMSSKRFYPIDIQALFPGQQVIF